MMSTIKLNELKTNAGREVKTQPEFKENPSVADLKAFLRTRKSQRQMPAYSKMKKAQLKNLAETLGYQEPADRKSKVADYKTFLRDYKTRMVVPSYSKMRKAQLLTLAKRFGYGTPYYRSVTIRFEYRSQTDKFETYWRPAQNTFSTEDKKMTDAQLFKKALQAATDIAQNLMSPNYNPEIRNLEIVSTTRIKSTPQEIANMKLYARGYSYTNLQMVNEYSENNQCVFDYLNDKHKKLIFDKLTPAEQQSLIGITPNQLANLLAKFNTTLLIEDLLKRPVISNIVDNRYREAKFNKRIPPIMLKIANNHIYVIEDKTERKCMKQRAIYTNNSITKKTEKKIPACKYIDSSTNLKAVFNTKELTHFYTNKDDLNDMFKEFLNLNIAPCVEITNSNITQLRIKNITLKCLPDGKDHFKAIQNIKKAILDEYKINIVGDGYGSIVAQLASGIEFEVEQSIFNNVVRDQFDEVSTGGLVANYEHAEVKNRENFYGLDENKSYTGAILEILKDIPVFNIDSKFEYFNDSDPFKFVEPNSFYLVATFDMDIGSQLIHGSSLSIALRINRIKVDEIKAVIRGKPMKDTSQVRNFVKQCMSLPGGKYLINSWIGLQARTQSSSNSKNILTRSREEAINYYHSNGQPLNNKFLQFGSEINEMTYLVNIVDKKPMPYISKPLYLAITQFTRMKMLQAKFDLEKLGAQVSAIKTDCIFFGIDSNAKVAYKEWAVHNVFNKKDVIPGRFKREKKSKVDIMFEEQQKSDIEEQQILSESSREQQVDSRRTLCKVLNMEEIRERTNRTLAMVQMDKPTVSDIVKYSKALITGGGGMGKSYLLANIVKHFEDQKMACKVLSPTNISSFVLKMNLEKNESATESKTIHNGLGIGIDNVAIKSTKKMNRVDVLILDECSMPTKAIWGLFINIIRSRPDIKLYVFGDWRQLPPIENYNVDFINLPILAEMFQIHIELTHNYRTNGNNEFVNYCKDVHDKKITLNPSKFGSNLEEFAICKTNMIRQEYNYYQMSLNKEKTVRKVSCKATLPKEHLKQLQTIFLYPGLPLQCISKEYAKKFKLEFLKRQFFTVKEVLENSVVITDESAVEFTLTDEQLSILMVPAYCSTIHSIQGKTLNKPYTILEYQHMTPKQIYTSLTRATDPNLISLSNNTFDCKTEQLEFIYDLLDNQRYAFIFKKKGIYYYGDVESERYPTIKKLHYYNTEDVENYLEILNKLN